MCCIFTCCGWMLDMIQRIWVFFMSCIISTGVCCVLITSSLSGVALGYNYSLAEYIDLKETNVSVFLKRGVFDDDVVDDLLDTSRRKGAPLSKLEDHGDLRTPTDEVDPEQMPQESGRRLDDTVVGYGRNKYEGGLMQMTYKPTPPFPVDTDTTPFYMTTETSLFPKPPPGGSLDQLKAIQGLINMRKSNANRDPFDVKTESSTLIPDAQDLLRMPEMSIRAQPEAYRRMMALIQKLTTIPQGEGTDLGSLGSQIKVHPARTAVPHSGNLEMDWRMQTMPEEEYRRVYELDGDLPGRPQPVTYKTGPLRPTITTTEAPMTPKILTVRVNTFSPIEDSPETSPEPSPRIVGSENVDYYEDEVKGLPVRRRRSLRKVTTQMTKELTLEVVTSAYSNFEASEIIPKETTASSSITVSKLHFPDRVPSNETTSTNEMEERNGTKTVGVTVNDTHPIRYFFNWFKMR